MCDRAKNTFPFRSWIVGFPFSLLIFIASFCPQIFAQEQQNRFNQPLLKSGPEWSSMKVVEESSSSDSTGSSPEPFLRFSDFRYYPWSVFVYWGKWSDNEFGNIILARAQTRDSHVSVAGGSRTVAEYNRYLLFETEFNAAKHFESQNHWAFNGALSARWMIFPWDGLVNSTLSFGVGPSYALESSDIEGETKEDTSRFLIYMVTELTFGPPGRRGSRWESFLRIHHRSGAFGLIRESVGSNFITFGVRYRFGN